MPFLTLQARQNPVVAVMDINAPRPISTAGITTGLNVVTISIYCCKDRIVKTPHPSSNDPQISDNELQNVKNTIFE